MPQGNHLHYSIYQYEEPVNPMKLNNVSGPPIPENLKADFKSKIEELKKLLK